MDEHLRNARQSSLGRYQRSIQESGQRTKALLAETQRVIAESAGSVHEENALTEAESYLQSSAFSRVGLIEQLEFGGFSTEDATFAVDRVVVDWREQAIKSAESYLESSDYSRSDLIGQLEFAGFTSEQAEYAVKQAGL
ncbi:MAG TPA: Ltp family lipoprotein [Phototrophicaceae bacterium]|nr:Ltp family lipoprotein [Phototrophicaceae bacterium]